MFKPKYEITFHYYAGHKFYELYSVYLKFFKFFITLSFDLNRIKQIKKELETYSSKKEGIRFDR